VRVRIVFSNKPIIGIVGGIGSGKSFVADLFGEFGCVVFHSDELARAAYNEARVKAKVAGLLGPAVLRSDGSVDRSYIAGRVFSDPEVRRKIEKIIHPIVVRKRLKAMNERGDDAGVVGFVWDSPLLMETGMFKQCDAMVFVNAPLELRTDRVAKSRKWAADELFRRENLQHPLDKKREISEYVIENTADADYARGQVKNVLSRIRGLFA